MALIPVKKRKKMLAAPVAGPRTEVKFSDVVIFLVEWKMGTSRRAFLSQLARKKGFRVEDEYSDFVTHVVSENLSGNDVLNWLLKRSLDGGHKEEKGGGETRTLPAFLNISWFTESMSAGMPVEIESKHQLKVENVAKKEHEKHIATYACQRRTPLLNHNTVFTDALTILSNNAEFNGSYGRSLAFVRAAAVLKSVPYTVRNMKDLEKIPCLGEHCRRVIEEILEDGISTEAQDIAQSERYQTLKLFTGIFGVGVTTAERWYQEGLRTLEDLLGQSRLLTREQQAGLLYYEDLQNCVSISEADVIRQIVEETIQAILPEAHVTLTGGFRRGKQYGHDVDCLITHPVEGQEDGLLPKVISSLNRQGLVLYHSINENTYSERQDLEHLSSKTTSFDHFERCFSIFKLYTQMVSGEGPIKLPLLSNLKTIEHCASDVPEEEFSGIEAEQLQKWKAVRVDLVVVPFSQYAYALLGWTGSKCFERELRRYASHEKNMILNSHALYDKQQKMFLPAESEEEIFAHLGLEYISPTDRNA